MMSLSEELMRKFLANYRENWSRELNYERNRRQQRDTHDKRQTDAKPACASALMFGKSVGQYRNENQIVYSEDNLHHNKHDQRRLSGRIRCQSQ